MLVQGCHGASADVRGRADLERQVVLGQMVHQLAILGSGDPVPDPYGAQSSDRIPDRLRPRRLARVRYRLQADGTSAGEHLGELRARDPHLGTAQPEADAAHGGPAFDPVDGPLPRHQAELTGDVEHPGEFDAVLACGAVASAGQCLRHPVGLDSHQQMRVGRHGELGIADVLSCESARHADHEILHVGGRADERVHGDVHVDEVGEVAEAVELEELPLVDRDTTVGMPAGQVQHGRHRRRTHEMHVQLGLRQVVDERRQVDRVRNAVAHRVIVPCRGADRSRDR